VTVLTIEEIKQKFAIASPVERFRVGEQPVYTFTIPGRDAIRKWHELRTVTPPFGYWPVVHGEEGEFQRQLMDRDEALSVDDLVTQAISLDVDEFFERRLEESNEPNAHGDWPTVSESEVLDFTLPQQSLGEGFRPELTMSLIPVAETWKVASVLNGGGWNEYPCAQEHIAVQRRWNIHYGAELVGMSGDVLEFKPARRPSSQEEALTLAREQFAYCSDLVYQGVGSIEALAASLLAGSIWYFWWD
jgi:hypothetical protein